MSDIYEILIRGVIAFLFPLLFIHLTGKQWLGQSTYAYFIGAISLGSIAGNTVFNIKIDLIDFILSLLVYCFIVYLSSIIAMKNKKLRRWIQGEPTLVIDNGTVVKEALQRLHLSLENLESALRKKDAFHIREIERALLEPDGSVTVLKKKEFRSLTREDITSVPLELVLDGKLQDRLVGQDGAVLDKLHEELRRKGWSISDLEYAVRGTDGSIYMIRRETLS